MISDGIPESAVELNREGRYRYITQTSRRVNDLLGRLDMGVELNREKGQRCTL